MSSNKKLHKNYISFDIFFQNFWFFLLTFSYVIKHLKHKFRDLLLFSVTSEESGSEIVPVMGNPSPGYQEYCNQSTEANFQTFVASGSSSEDETLSTWTRTKSLHFKKARTLSDLLDNPSDHLRNASSGMSAASINEDMLLY